MRRIRVWLPLFALVFLRLLYGQTAAEDAAAGARLFRLDNYAKARPFWLRAESEFANQSNKERALYARVSRLRGDSEAIFCLILPFRKRLHHVVPGS